MKKTLLSLLLILCLCLPMLVACESAEPDAVGESEIEETISETASEAVQNTFTEGLGYSKLPNGTYEVSLGKVKRVANLVIPSEYEGAAVTQIASEGFMSNHTIQSVTIPDSVKTIGNSAFFGCDRLTSIVYGENCSLQFIGNDAFSGCWGLTNIYIPKSVALVGERAFVCSKIESITVEEGNNAYYSEGNCLLTKGSKRLVRGCQNSVIPTDGSVIEIDDFAFLCCIGLESIIIPGSVMSIGDQAFEQCDSLKTVYYMGSEEEWAKINVSSFGNDKLTSANIIYNYVPEE